MANDKCVLVCRVCTDFVVLPFYTQQDRGHWAAEHRKTTGHNWWFCLEGWPRPAEIFAEMARLDEFVTHFL